MLTKEHTINYEEHTYYKDKIIPTKIEKEDFTKKDWIDKNFRLNIFRNYFKNNNLASTIQCIEYIKGKFGKDIDINDEIKKEINSARVAININIKNKQNILDQISNLKDNNNNPISILYEYESLKNDKKKYYSFWIIINKEMNKILIDNKNNQYFGDTTYKCIPPTFHKYKLFVISAYNLIKKNINICCFSLIPNEKEITYIKLFEILKNNYKFNPIIFTLDFSKSISNALKNVYPDCIQIKCFFHYIQAIVRKLKKLGLYKKENYIKNNEILFNLKYLSFIEPSKIKKFYEKIENEYSDEEKYGEFF